MSTLLHTNFVFCCDCLTQSLRKLPSFLSANLESVIPTCSVKVLFANGTVARITLEEEKFDATTKQLILDRIWHGARVCRGRYDLQKKSVVPCIRQVVPQLLDVYDTTTESLIDALHHDQYEMEQVKKTFHKLRCAKGQVTIPSFTK